MNKHLLVLLSAMATLIFFSCENKSDSEFGNKFGGHSECSHCHGSGTCSACSGTGHGSTTTCSYCNGAGSSKCSACLGKGKIMDGVGAGFNILYKSCPYCNGVGYKTCSMCNGNGYSQSQCSSCNGTGICTYCSGSGGGTDQGGSFSSTHAGDSRYCIYLGKVIGYWELGDDIETEIIYVYHTQPGKTLRASFVGPDKDGYIVKSATETVYSGSDPWGLRCNKYMNPIGTRYYFTWK